MKKINKIIFGSVSIFAVLCIAIMLVCNQLVISNAKGKAFPEIDSIKPAEVGLLLGTTPQTRIGHRRNLFFTYRIDAAEQLYKAGKIKKILISGDDNSLEGINEPECMRDSLVARGIPVSVIFLDGKGYRTICSVVNANKVYGLKSFTIISQKFHNERAIYQTEHIGLDVKNIQAYNAKSPNSKWAILTYAREYLARVKMFWDIWTDCLPKDFGEQISLEGTREKPRSCDTLPEWAERLKEIPLPSYMQVDFPIDVFFKYNQLVNGYEVTARWRP